MTCTIPQVALPTLSWNHKAKRAPLLLAHLPPLTPALQNQTVDGIIFNVPISET